MSICITLNKTIQDLPEMLAADEVIAAAILDQMLNDSHVINSEGRSYRLKEL